MLLLVSMIHQLVVVMFKNENCFEVCGLWLLFCCCRHRIPKRFPSGNSKEPSLSLLPKRVCFLPHCFVFHWSCFFHPLPWFTVNDDAGWSLSVSPIFFSHSHSSSFFLHVSSLTENMFWVDCCLFSCLEQQLLSLHFQRQQPSHTLSMQEDDRLVSSWCRLCVQ